MDPNAYADPTSFSWLTDQNWAANTNTPPAATYNSGGMQSLTDALFNSANTIVAAGTAAAVRGIVPSGLPVAPINSPMFNQGFNVSSLLPILLIAGVGFVAVKMLKK